MDNSVVRAYIWNEVLNSVFVANEDDKSWVSKWLVKFIGSLASFWQNQPILRGPSIKESQYSLVFENSELQFTCNMKMPDTTTINADYYHLDGRMMMHDSDSTYYMFYNSTLLDEKQKNIAFASATEDDLAAIVDAMVMHPRDHIHIEHPPLGHHIRISGTVFTPFVYLFHLRVQLCKIDEVRNAERNRLIELFWRLIKTGAVISVDDIMAIPVVPDSPTP